MQVRITKQIVELDPDLFMKELNIEKSDLRYHKHTDIDLRCVKESGLKKILALVKTNANVGRDVRSLIKDIENFNYLKKEKGALKTVRARTVRHACDLLIEYFKRNSPRKHVYEKIQDGDESVTVAYYVDRIKYNPPDKRRDYMQPEFISIRMVYKQFGIVKSKNCSIEREGCLGMTARDILIAADLAWEGSILRMDYETYLERYNNWWDKVGLQMTAVGFADDEGVDGNDEDEDGWRRSWRSGDSWRLDRDGEPARVVIDVFQEEEKDISRESDSSYSNTFWDYQTKIKYEADKEATADYDGEEEWDEEDEETKQGIEIPIHPYVVCFDLKKHKRLKVHVGNLEVYEYDKSIREKLVLPEASGRLIDVLLTEKDTHFRDIVKGKTGGVLVLCQGPPGTGKTLTAEVYSEYMERPLYTVQCAQLGIDAEDLEKNLMKILRRGRRWNACMLLDEADVYVHQRGNDLVQNAIVGVFLRVLEYQSGVLFMTTNRGDLVDDAILSRCTARIPYGAPDITQQHRIWRVLADANGIELSDKRIKEIVDEQSKLSGRDIKNLLKLGAMVAHDRKTKINAELISEMKIFKPTIDQMEVE